VVAGGALTGNEIYLANFVASDTKFDAKTPSVSRLHHVT